MSSEKSIPYYLYDIIYLMSNIIKTFNFNVVPTIKAFTKDNKYIKAIMGPVGSGKSSGCVINLLNYSCQQQPYKDGVRRTRWAIVRNTYAQLKDTTKKTIEEWLPFAHWKEGTNSFHINVKLQDGTSVQSEWLLRALDRPDQTNQLLSLELTGAWLNEARELPVEVFNDIKSRIPRYPKKDPDWNDYGPTWFGVMMDTNPPDVDHWWYKYFEEKRETDEEVRNLSSIFYQPSGLSPEAENLVNLDANYYERISVGQDEDWIRVYVHSQYGYLKDGEPVHKRYQDNFHVAEEEIQPYKNHILIIGMDCSGLHPAAVITQSDPKGRILILDELVGGRMSSKEFFTFMLKPLLRQKYPLFQHLIVGDPAGNAESQVDRRTVYMEMREQGLNGRPAMANNSLQRRLGAVDSFLTRIVDGKPGLLLSPQCNTLRKALSGGYRFKRLRLSGDRYSEMPDKTNGFADIADSLQYACVFHENGINNTVKEAEYSYMRFNKDFLQVDKEAYI